MAVMNVTINGNDKASGIVSRVTKAVDSVSGAATKAAASAKGMQKSIEATGRSALQVNKITDSVKACQKQIQSAQRQAAKGLQLKADIIGIDKSLQQLAAIKKARDNVDGDDAHVRVNVESSGVPQTNAALATVAEARHAASGNVDIDTKHNLPGIAALSHGLLGMSKQFITLSAVAETFKVEGLMTAVGAIAPLALGAAGAVGQLSVGIGSGLAGAMVVGGSATYGMVGALKVYTKVISGAVSASRTSFEATHKNATAQLEQQRNTILNTQASKDFNNVLNVSIIAASQFQAAIGKAVLPVFGRELAAWTKELDNFQGGIVKTAGTIAQMAAGFSRFVRTAQGGRLLANIIGFINQSAIKGTQILYQLGKAGLLVFQHIIPYASRVQSQLVGLAFHMQQWVASAKGGRIIEQVLDFITRRMYQMVGIGVNLVKVLFNIFHAISGARNMENILNPLYFAMERFANATKPGSEGAKRITSFMKAMQPVVKAVGPLFMDVAKHILEMADNMAHLKTEGGQSVLVQMVNSIHKAVIPIIDDIGSTFESLAPALNKLIPEIGKFLGTFLGSTTPTEKLIDILTKVFKYINDLPGPVKNAAVQIAGFNEVMGFLGLPSASGVVSTLAGIYTNFKLLGGLGSVSQNIGAVAQNVQTAGKDISTTSHYAEDAQPALTGFGDAMAAAGTGAAAVGEESAAAAPKMGLLGKAGGAVKGALLFFVSGPGIAIGAALAALAAGAILVYKNWDKIKAALQPAIQGFKTFWNFVKPFAAALGGAVVQSLKSFASGILSVISPGAKMGGQMHNLSDSIGDVARRAIPYVIKGLQAFTGFLKSHQGAIQAFGHIVGVVVVGGFRLLWKAIKIGAAIVRGVVKGMVGLVKAAYNAGKAVRHGFGDAWNALKHVVSTAWNAVKHAVVNGVKGVVNNLKQGWNNAKRNTQAVWNGIKRVLSTVWNAIKRAASQWWNNQKRGWSNLWDTIKRGASTIWNGIKRLLSTVWNAIKRLATTFWNNEKRGWQTLWNAVKKITQTVWNAIKSVLSTVWNAIKRVASAWWSAEKRGWQTIWNTVKSITTKTWDSIKSGLTKVWNGIKTAAQNLWNDLKKVWNTVKDGTTSAWHAVGQAIHDELQKGWDAAKSVWNTILEGIAKALDVLQLHGMADSVRSAKFAQGGTTDKGTGQGGKTNNQMQVARHAKGGLEGGIGTAGRNERVHVWNEQMGNEAYIAERGPRNKQLQYLQHAASWFGATVVPMAKGGIAAIQKFAQGGMPPKQKWNRYGGDRVVGYTAEPGLASKMAAAGAAMWKGIVQAGGPDVHVVIKDLPGAMRGLSWSNGLMQLDPRIKPKGAAHEFGHMAGLAHWYGGGFSIMNAAQSGATAPTANDFRAVNTYYGAKPKGAPSTSGGSAPHRGGWSPGGQDARGAPGPQRQSQRVNMTGGGSEHIVQRQGGSSNVAATGTGSSRDKLRAIINSAMGAGFRFVEKGDPGGDMPLRDYARRLKHRYFENGGLSSSQLSSMRSRGEQALGKPYKYGPNGTYHMSDGYSCSGLWDWIVSGTHAVSGPGTYSYYNGMPGWSPGPGQVEVGVSLSGEGGVDGTHMAGDILGTSYESTTTQGVHHGRSAGDGFARVFHIGDATRAAAQTGSGGGFNPVQAALDRIWNGTIGKAFDSFGNATNGKILPIDALGQYITGPVQSNIKDFLYSHVPFSSGGGSVPSGSLKGSGMDMVTAALRADGLPVDWAKKSSTWNILRAESSSTPAHLNFSPPGQSSQFIAPWEIITPNRYGVTNGSSEMSKVAVGPKYISDQYGDPDKAWAFHVAHGWYKRGGVVPGRRGMPVPAMLHGGEMVLPGALANAVRRVAVSDRPHRSGRLGGNVVPDAGASIGRSVAAREGDIVVNIHNPAPGTDLAELERSTKAAIQQALDERDKRRTRNRRGARQQVGRG